MTANFTNKKVMNKHMKKAIWAKSMVLWLALVGLASCQPKEKEIEFPKTDMAKVSLIPMPSKVVPTHSAFGLDKYTAIYTDQTTSGFEEVGQFLADKLKTRINSQLPVNTSGTETVKRIIYITQTDTLGTDSPEVYQLYVRKDSILIQSKTAAGAFRGIQTLQQLLPEKSNDTLAEHPIWPIPTGKIDDAPNFVYRGAMLDVARHFFSVAEVKKYIDLLAYYKYNAFHMHLADDQGWRIEIEGWPKLTEVGAKTEVGGGTGGFYTQEDFKELVRYAAERHMEIIPEIDMPGHTNAANLSYPILHDARGKAETPRVRTDMLVGYSSFDTKKDTVYAFIDDVVSQIAAISPSPYFHIGGDETHATKKADYIHFVERVEKIVQKHGKRMMGWNEIAQATIHSSTVNQLWNDPKYALKAAANGCQIVLSPAKKAYLDMQYDTLSKHGLHWAAYIPVDDAYNWDPETFIEGLPKANILGIEAPLWSETISNSTELEYLAFPRAIGYAELGWSTAANRDWETYKVRLADQVPFLKRMDVNFYRSKLIAWGD